MNNKKRKHPIIKQRGDEMTKSLGIKIFMMKNGEEVIANTDKFDSEKVIIHYPLKLITESQIIEGSGTVNYKISFRSWLRHSPQQHIVITKDIYYLMVDPYDDIAKQYIDIIRKLPKEDINYIDMEEILSSDKYSTPKGMGEGFVQEGIREPTKSELDKVIAYLECSGFSVVDSNEILDNDDVQNDDEERYCSSDDVDDEEDDNNENNKWNPHDRWSS